MPTYEPTGSLVTETQSFDTPQQPTLAGLQYSLNDQTITVDVVGSPGTSDEETHSQTLDGASSYDLSWSEYHSEYRLEFALSTSDDSTSPEPDDVDLQGADPPVVSITDARETELDLDWGDVGADSYTIYVAEASGAYASDYTVDGTTTGTSYTITGLEHGERYHVRVSAETSGANALSEEHAATTDVLVSPITGFDTSTNGEITVEWGREDASPDGDWALYRSQDDSLGALVVDGLSPSTTSYTDTGVDEWSGLPEYRYTLRRRTDHATAEYSLVTSLPDDDEPVLGNGVEDEIAVDRETSAASYGSVRVQTRETGQSSWSSSATGFDEQVLAYDTLETIVTEREDGERYETRLRTETEHRTGAWTQAVAITTKFPGATSAAVTTTESTSVSVEAQDNADNETGFELEREERINGEWRDHRVVADVGPHGGEGAISITDDTASPGTEYRYRVRPYTEHTSAVSNWTDPVTTPGLEDATTARTGSSGWQLRVEHQDGSIHRPRTAGTPSYQPTINGLPKARIPVPMDEKWQANGFENAHVEAWLDGRRLPVDELVDVEDESDRMVLVVEGGTLLRDRVQREVDEADAHTTAESIITDTIGYAANVDDPAASTRGDVLMADADTDVEFQQELADAPFPDDDPRTIEDGRLSTHQCAHVIEAEEMDTGTADPGDLNQDIYSSGEGTLLDGEFTLSGSVTTEYDYPDGDALVGIRINYFDQSVPGFEIRVDNQTVLSYDPGDNPIIGIQPPHWVDANISGGLSAGTHDIEIEVTGWTEETGEVIVDIAGVADERYTSFGSDELPNDQGRLPDPRLHPASISVETVDNDSIEQVVAGSLDATVTSTANNQGVAVSNDQGSSWIEAQNSATVSGEFDEGGAQLRARFTLSYYDSGGGPVVYDSGTEVDLFELRASLNDTPLLVNKSYDASGLSVLNEIADYGDFVWQLWYNPETGGYQIDWTQPGQRTNSLDPSVVDYNSTKRMRDLRYGTAVVKGSNRPVSGDRWTPTYGTAVDVYQDQILEGSEAVTDPSDGTQYERGSDYSMDYATGAVTALESGDLSESEEYAISYEYRTQGSYTSPSADEDASELVRDFAGATDDRECGQIALNIIKNIQSPVWEVSLTVDSLPPGQLLVDEIAWPIPTGGRTVEIQSVDSGPGSVEVSGTGESLGEVVSDIRGRVEANTQRS